jgi:DNA-binding MarR family transcriptional regulator
MTEEIVLSEAQLSCLKAVSDGGKVETKTVDKRSVNALEKKGLVKVTENKKGAFVALTAKGKKAAAAMDTATPA